MFIFLPLPPFLSIAKTGLQNGRCMKPLEKWEREVMEQMRSKHKDTGQIVAIKIFYEKSEKVCQQNCNEGNKVSKGLLLFTLIALCIKRDCYGIKNLYNKYFS